MGKIKSLPFTAEQVKECLSCDTPKTAKEIATELIKKMQKSLWQMPRNFIAQVKGFLLTLFNSNLLKRYEKDEGEYMFALA